MFFAGSRYLSAKQTVVTTPSGTTVAVISPYRSSSPAALLGFYRPVRGQRLDQIANYYLSDATTFWKLCDANGSVVPDALAHATLVGIPKGP
jgi:hypothetical protein